jgi:hypothetical protein
VFEVSRLAATVVCVVVLVAPFAVSGPAGAAPPRARRFAFEVNGEPTPVAEVRPDLRALAKNKGLNIVDIKDQGDLTPVREVVASYLTTLILDQVTAQELERRGVAPTMAQVRIARRLDIRIYGRKAWNEFPERFRTRDIGRTARAIALAVDEGFDLTKRREVRRELIALVISLAKQASVTVAPRFGTWNPDLAVVVAPSSQSETGTPLAPPDMSTSLSPPTTAPHRVTVTAPTTLAAAVTTPTVTTPTVTTPTVTTPTTATPPCDPKKPPYCPK